MQGWSQQVNQNKQEKEDDGLDWESETGSRSLALGLLANKAISSLGVGDAN